MRTTIVALALSAIGCPPERHLIKGRWQRSIKLLVVNVHSTHIALGIASISHLARA